MGGDSIAYQKAYARTTIRNLEERIRSLESELRERDYVIEQLAKLVKFQRGQRADPNDADYAGWRGGA